MLTQYKLTLTPERPCRPRYEWAYCLYAALLRQAPSGFGSAAHEDCVTPVSQYLTTEGERLVWTVNLLGRASEEALTDTLEQASGFLLDREQLRLAVTERERFVVTDADTLLEQAAACDGLHRLEFCTPTAFKSRGKYQTLPTVHLLLQSLLRQWNGCILECPIEDGDGQGLEALADGLSCGGFRLHSRDYRLKGRPIHGFQGSLTLENHLTGFHRQLADALLLFGTYSGVGIKTTLGMGGMRRT